MYLDGAAGPAAAPDGELPGPRGRDGHAAVGGGGRARRGHGAHRGGGGGAVGGGDDVAAAVEVAADVDSDHVHLVLVCKGEGR